MTSHLYSGEQTDPTGLQYLRARYYDPAIGRFNRLDPFAGNFEDPQSLHKYLYCHADPINGIDPSGEFFSLMGLMSGMYTNFSMRAASWGALGGGTIGAISGGIDGYLANERFDEAIVGAFLGGVTGAGLGSVSGGYAGALSSRLAACSLTTQARFLKMLFVGNIAGAGYGVYSAESWGQATFRGFTGAIGSVSSIASLRLLSANRTKLLREVARLAQDAETGEERLVQAVGGYRLQRFLGQRLNPGKAGVDDGCDYIASNGTKIQLKGPFLEKGTLAPLENVDISKLAAGLNKKIVLNSAPDKFYIDTLGLSDMDATKLQKLVTNHNGKVVFLR